MAELDTLVPHYMSTPVYALRPDMSLEEADGLLRDWRVSAAAVVDDDSLVGVLSLTDLLRVGRSEAEHDGRGIALKLPASTVADAMTRELVTIDAKESVRDGARRMVDNQVHRLFVVEAGKLAGVLSTRDIMDALANQRVPGLVSDFATSPIEAVRAEEPIATALVRMQNKHISGLVVLEDGWPVGAFTQREALVARDLPDGAAVEWAMNPALLAMPHDTPLHRAASQASAMDVRWVVTRRGQLVEGVVTGLDFCRAAANA
jgi:predicted transcriptional regulator